jgi:hypothetical protein
MECEVLTPSDDSIGVVTSRSVAVTDLFFHAIFVTRN